MTVIIGCDPNAKSLKEELKQMILSLGHEVEDQGSDDPIYGHTAIRVAEAVAAGKASRGVLLCGTGLGMCLAANKVRGAYAALLTDAYSAERAILSNNSNIACIGARTIGVDLAKLLLKTWLSLEYDPNCRSREKVACYQEYDIAR